MWSESHGISTPVTYLCKDVPKDGSAKLFISTSSNVAIRLNGDEVNSDLDSNGEYIFSRRTVDPDRFGELEIVIQECQTERRVATRVVD